MTPRRLLYGLESLPLAGLALAAWFAAGAEGGLAPIVAALSTVAAYVLLRLYITRLHRDKEALAREREISAGAVEALALAIDAREPYSRGHARRVQAYAREIGRLALAEGFAGDAERDPQWLDSLATAALLHDVGKLGIPDILLCKRSPLTPAEEEKLRQHSVLGEMIVARMRFARPVDRMVRWHHERWDGQGHPDGLAGADIPLEARIIHLADQLDVQRRTHPTGVGPDVAALAQHAESNAGGLFDPRLAHLYCAHAEEIEHSLAGQGLSAAVGDASATSGVDPLASNLGEAPREAAVLFDLACRLGASLRIDDTLGLVASRLLELLPAHSCALYLNDAARNELVTRHAAGPLAAELQQRTYTRSAGAIGWAFATGRPVVNGDPRGDLGADCEIEAGRAVSSLVFPISDGKQVLGVIGLYSDAKNAFTDNHIRILETLAPQLAQVLGNALLFAETLSSSMTDLLTGLPNSRFLTLQLQQEFARAIRKCSPLSMVVIDLDGFKAINDRYGHLAGDGALRAVAHRFRECFRAQDVVTRYAGDEFVVLMSETSPEEARRIVERVRDQVASCRFEVAPRESVHLSFSAGISCFPVHGDSLDELLRQADKEMFADKAARKKTVVA